MRSMVIDASASTLTLSGETDTPASVVNEARRLAAEALALSGWSAERADEIVDASSLKAFLSARGMQVS